MDAAECATVQRPVTDLDRKPWQVAIHRIVDDSLVCTQRTIRPYLVVGSDADCDLRIEHPSVRGRCLYLHQLPGGLAWIDLEHPGGDVAQPGRIPLGDFYLTCSDLAAEQLVRIDQSSRAALAEPVALWKLFNAKSEFHAWSERRARHLITLIGRGPACRIRIEHASISPVHASLVWADGRLYALDLCSRSGVRVNGRRVRFSALDDGDELTIGVCRGRIELLAASRVARAETSRPSGAVEPIRIPAEPVSRQTAEAAEELQTPEGVQQNLRSEIMDETHMEESNPVRNDTEQFESPPEPEVIPANEPAQQRVLQLLNQVMTMHQEVLEESQRLVHTTAQKLDEASVPVESALPENSTLLAPASLIASDQPLQPLPSLESESPAGEVHAWLTGQLANLEPEPGGGLAKLWRRITGAG